MGGELRPASAEQFKIKLAAAAADQVAEDLAHDAGELKPVARARAGDENLWKLWMPVDPEVCVGCVGVTANGRGYQRTISGWKKASHQLSHVFDFLRENIAVHAFRQGDFSIMMARYFHARPEVREPIEKPAPIAFPKMNGAGLRPK